MGIHRDWTRESKVVWCDCGWSDVGVSTTAARSLMADHERRAHPDQTTVQAAERQRRKYAADRASEPHDAE